MVSKNEESALAAEAMICAGGGLHYHLHVVNPVT
jgi:hypothetical protein